MAEHVQSTSNVSNPYNLPDLQFANQIDAPPAVDILTDDFIHERFIDAHKDEFLFDGSSKQWMIYKGCMWVEAKRAEVQNALLNFLRTNLKDFITKYGPPLTDKGEWTSAHYKLMSRFSSPAGLKAILEMATYDSSNHVSPSEFDRDKHLLNTPTLVINLKTGERFPHDPKFMMTRRTVVGPSRMPTPLFLQFLHDFAQGDEAVMAFLQRFCGYCLTGETREHKLLFLCGPGGNGKSLILNLLRMIMGSYAKTANAQILMKGAENRHTTEVAELVGARFVTILELPGDGMWSQQRITSLTGGDTLSARRMYQDNFEFDPQFKLVLSGNHRPAIQNPDRAFLRRMLFLESLFRPEKPDTELPEKLRAEYGGILQWMIEGAVLYYRDGLAIPDSILEATKDYAADEDDVAQWLKERCVVEEGATAASRELFNDYSEWAVETGAREYKLRSLSERVAALGYKRDKRKQKRGFVGLRLVTKEGWGNPFTQERETPRAYLQ